MSCPHCNRKKETVIGKWGIYETTGSPYYQNDSVFDGKFSDQHIKGYWTCLYCGWILYDKLRGKIKEVRREGQTDNLKLTIKDHYPFIEFKH